MYVFFSLTTECFENAVRISPEQGYSKYMNLGQLLEGQEAVATFNKGIQLMIASKDDESSQVHLPQLLVFLLLPESVV